MTGLLAADNRQRFPIFGWRKPAQIEIGATIQDCSRDAHDSAKPHEFFLIDFILTKQIGVVAEIAKEPTEFPKSSRSAIEPARKGTALLLLGFQDAQLQDVERSLGMPAIESSIDAGQ